MTQAPALPPAAGLDVAADFQDFYAAKLCRAFGDRIGSTDLMAQYQAWAQSAGRSSLSFRELGRMMAERRHRRIRSDGMKYLDVALRQAS